MYTIKVSGKTTEKLGKDKTIERFDDSLTNACLYAQDVFNQRSFTRSYVLVTEPNGEPLYIYGTAGEKNYAGIQLPPRKFKKDEPIYTLPDIETEKVEWRKHVEEQAERGAL